MVYLKKGYYYGFYVLIKFKRDNDVDINENHTEILY